MHPGHRHRKVCCPSDLIDPLLHMAHCFSPELVAKLGHDYTVYAYDFSEYETPLVGQGMLSWILASASSTPNAPADESQTMVTGRVCKNILGIFSNGVKETLEVKLKLVPVPTCMQKEYVENMERYHSLSQLMPEGFDYSAWSDFLKENPTLGQLAQPNPGYPAQHSPRPSFGGGVEPFHQMLTRQNSSQEPPRNDSFHDMSNASFQTQNTRASSPAMSTISFHHYQHNPESRPASRGSVRSDVAPPTQQFPFSDPYVIEQQEDGPPKKRARIIQAKRPKRTPLTAHNDSLRVTASTAASVRLHRPILGNSAAAADLVPRAPTPRPGDTFGNRGQRRPPAPSALRHASMDYGQPYMSPYDSSTFSDNAIDSADETEASPEGTFMDMPSSPPVALQDNVSPAPSSPALPTLPVPTDSGFVSDMPTVGDEDNFDFGDKIWDGSDLPLAMEERAGSKPNRSQRRWQHVNPGPIEHLPQSYVPRPKQHYRKYPVQPVTESIEQDTASVQPADIDMLNEDFFNPILFQQQQMNDESATGPTAMSQPDHQDYNAGSVPPLHTFSFGTTEQQPSQCASQPGSLRALSPTATNSRGTLAGESEILAGSRSGTPNPHPLPKQSKTSKPRGLPRSNTWSGPNEPMSDAPAPAEPSNPRSGSGAKRKKYIKERLEKAIAAGEMPQHCANCGEIDTPAWRKAYTRVETGTPDEIELSTDTASTDVIAYETIESTAEKDGEPKYRIFKNNLTREEKASNMFESLNLCNPCGLWLMKKASMRPQKQWDKTARASKRKRNQAAGIRSQSMTHGDDLVSDAVMPDSEPIMSGEQEGIMASFEGSRNGIMPPPPVQATTEVADVHMDAAQAALHRAIQSSPAGLRGTKHSPVDVDADLTPKPTRRLLFPSPTKDGEVKSLAAGLSSTASEGAPNYMHDREVPEKPRCQRCKVLKKGCDRERPCGRCDNAGIGYEGCIPCEPPRTNWFEQPVVCIAAIDEQGPDKENCPPPPLQEDDDNLAHLFEDPASAKTTPKKDQLLQDLLKTPTPGSRHRAPLTPKSGAETAALLMTPSRILLTPRSNRGTTAAPDTPFTRHLNALLSDCPMPSPSQTMDFSSLATFTSPGRAGANFSDFLHDDFLSSDMPVPSSPLRGSLGLSFDLYEDPNTSTVGLWSGASIFGSDAILPETESGAKDTSTSFDEGVDAATLLKMNVGGITVDFAAMIDEVVSAAKEDAEKQAEPTPVANSPEAQSLGLANTPEEPVAE